MGLLLPGGLFLGELLWVLGPQKPPLDNPGHLDEKAPPLSHTLRVLGLQLTLTVSLQGFPWWSRGWASAR